MCKGTRKFAITRHLQTILCLLGQSTVFEEASKLLKELLGVQISGMQIQRVSEYYGSLTQKAITRNIETCIPKLKEVSKDDSIYLMMDGSMIPTREDNWKEMKLARIFNERKLLEMSKSRSEIVESVYVSHLGSVDTFFPKLERHLCDYEKKVIIGDGAKWIWNWAESNYPNATQILDFYHAKEKLVILSNQYFGDDTDRKKWVDEQSEKLLEDEVEQVIQIIKKMRCKNGTAKVLKEKTLQYFLEHEDRMLYKTYRSKGLLIGSGPIEAAHRSVLQTRMKRSGQKWSIKGANAIANLRCLHKSNAWNILENFVKAAA